MVAHQHHKLLGLWQAISATTLPIMDSFLESPRASPYQKPIQNDPGSPDRCSFFIKQTLRHLPEINLGGNKFNISHLILQIHFIVQQPMCRDSQAHIIHSKIYSIFFLKNKNIRWSLDRSLPKATTLLWGLMPHCKVLRYKLVVHEPLLGIGIEPCK